MSKPKWSQQFKHLRAKQKPWQALLSSLPERRARYRRREFGSPLS